MLTDPHALQECIDDVIATLGKYAFDYDVEAIAIEAYTEGDDGVIYVSDDYWDIVDRHELTESEG